MRTRAACAAAEARRASSCPPAGLLRPYGPSGSYIAMKREDRILLARGRIRARVVLAGECVASVVHVHVDDAFDVDELRRGVGKAERRHQFLAAGDGHRTRGQMRSSRPWCPGAGMPSAARPSRHLPAESRAPGRPGAPPPGRSPVGNRWTACTPIPAPGRVKTSISPVKTAEFWKPASPGPKMTPVTSCKGFSTDASVCSDSSRAWESGHKICPNDAPQLLHLRDRAL